MKKIIIILLFLVIVNPHSFFCQDAGKMLYKNIDACFATNYISCESTDSCIIFLGEVFDSNGKEILESNLDLSLFKLDKNGNEIWRKNIGKPDIPEHPSGLSSYNGTICISYNEGNSILNCNTHLILIDESGKVIKQTNIKLYSLGCNFSRNGDIFVYGSTVEDSQNPSKTTKNIIYKINQSAEIIWIRMYSNSEGGVYGINNLTEWGNGNLLFTEGLIKDGVSIFNIVNANNKGEILQENLLGGYNNFLCWGKDGDYFSFKRTDKTIFDDSVKKNLKQSTTTVIKSNFNNTSPIWESSIVKNSAISGLFSPIIGKDLSLNLIIQNIKHQSMIFNISNDGNQISKMSIESNSFEFFPQIKIYEGNKYLYSALIKREENCSLLYFDKLIMSK